MAKEGMRIALREPEAEIVRQIMEQTGVGTGADAVAMLLRQCGRRFVKWWELGCAVTPTLAAPQSVPAPVEPEQPDSDFGEPIQM